MFCSSIQNRQYTLPAGIRNCWMVWRHCCCRYGSFPLALAPFITAALVLSAYSTVGCQFVDLQIGFVPSSNNNAWNNQSNALLGLYYRYDDDDDDDDDSTSAAAAAAAAATEEEEEVDSNGDSSNKYQDYILQPDCISYNTAFDSNFVEPDRTWTIARVMALIAVGATCLSTITVWAMVVTPGAKCLWGGFLLPCTMLALIAEGSKFLFLDIAMCRSAIWFPSGVDSLPTSAETCELGETAYYCIAAGALHLVSLLAVCLHAPERRELDPDFGIEYRTGAEVDLEDAVAKQTQQQRQQHQPEGLNASCTRSTKSPAIYEGGLDEESVLEDDVYTTSSEPYSATAGTTDEDKMQQDPNPNSMESPIKEESSNITPPTSFPENVSESRLSTMSKVEQNASSPPRKQELVQLLVSELNSCCEGKL